MARPRIGADERRARLARRHLLAPGHAAEGVVEAARALVGLHATDPATVYLSAWARVPGFAPAQLDRALYAERSLVKHLCMRRTLFVLPRDLLGAVQAGAADRVAAAESRRLVRDVERAGLQADGAAWLAGAGDAVLAALAGGREATAAELRAEVPALAGEIVYGEGRSWGGPVPVAPRVLTVLSAGGRIVRASNVGAWTTSRPRWAAAESWLGGPVEAPGEAAGLEALVAAWLRTFGPGTEQDVTWWLGSTRTAVRRALAALEAVAVDLAEGTGFVLPDDVSPTGPVEPWAALLPGLDPTPMGWVERDWYLGPHKPHVFDGTGNVGPTAWWDGRIVGGWRQDAAGEVVVQLLEDVGAEGRAALAARAAELTAFLAGTQIRPRFPSPLSKGDPGGGTPSGAPAGPT